MKYAFYAAQFNAACEFLLEKNTMVDWEERTPADLIQSLMVDLIKNDDNFGAGTAGVYVIRDEDYDDDNVHHLG